MNNEFIKELESRVNKDVEVYLQSLKDEADLKEIYDVSEKIQTKEFVQELAEYVTKLTFTNLDKVTEICKDKGLSVEQSTMVINQFISWFSLSQANHYKKLLKEKLEAEKGEKA